MTDNTELKRLAEAAQEDPNSPYLPCPVAFMNAATPSVVLALIAENERLKKLRSTTERDLAQELEVWRNGPSCWSCGDTGDVHDIVGEWRGQCDCNAAKLIDVTGERDQFKAENAGLKTGYEAYERVNAELKAEVARSTEREILQLAEIEALRIANTFLLPDAQRHRWLRANGYDMGSFHREHEHNDKAWFECLDDSAIDEAIAGEAIDAALGQGEQS
ncbi:hypothetical protein [Pseudomonas sp. MF7451]|uniref:hypothetical protein n=1 Tax=Pseudomonas sp. MF7451 TaxID=2797538 RepID=UPI0018E86C27|nr:hypothetical protein [Pseudomonas sp. MF7451]MBJ2224932.1 hypothetical protein [Pseudomonas sp. MF7451]